MPYDAVNMADWQISEAAEKNMPTPDDWQEKLGLQKDEMLPMGRLSKVDFLKIIDRLKDKPDGKYVEVTAITPTPLGEGKSTTSVGLMEGLGKRGVNVGGVLKSLHERGLIDVVGRAEGLGRPLLYGTTGLFLEHFALRHLEELPRADELAVALRHMPADIADTPDVAQESPAEG